MVAWTGSPCKLCLFEATGGRRNTWCTRKFAGFETSEWLPERAKAKGPIGANLGLASGLAAARLSVYFEKGEIHD